ncbi:hypothetical protein ES705_29636 [subsurface metagenome]
MSLNRGAVLDRWGLGYIQGRLCAGNVGGFSLAWRGTNMLWWGDPDPHRCTTRYCVGRHRCRKSLLLALRLHLERKDRCACRRGFSIGLSGIFPGGSPCSSIGFCAPEKGLLDPSPGSCPGTPGKVWTQKTFFPVSKTFRGSYFADDQRSSPGGC